MQNAVRNRCLFLRWLHRDFPDVYNAAMEHTLSGEAQADGLSDLVDSITGLFDKLAKSVPVIAQTYGNVKTQIDWMKLNIERARQGLPPLDPKTGLPVAGSAVAAPAPGTPAAAAETKVATSAPSAAGIGIGNIPTWALIAGAVGLGALLMG